MERLGERIRQARLRGVPPLRLVDLAGEGLSPGMLSKIERGLVSPSLATLAYLAQRLEVPLARLFDDEAPAQSAPWEAALQAAQACLWLGDPGEAGRRALALAEQAGASRAGAGIATADRPAAAPPARAASEVAGGGREGVADAGLVRAAALGLAAQAFLERGDTGAAAAAIRDASAALAATTSDEARPGRGAAGIEAHLAWVLGLLERRRGQLADAERSWTRCLDLLEGQEGEDPLAWYAPERPLLRARVLLELGALQEVLGAPQTARSFLVRGATLLRWLADPAAVARTLLEAGQVPPGAPAPASPALLPHRAGPAAAQPAQSGSEPAIAPRPSTTAAVLAAVALAPALLGQAEQRLARLDRLTTGQAAMSSPAPVSHSRHLR
ncbi:MAG TPA: helix-turn-helix transcriptional regulator [Chloroflexota bacterium]|nr:helix-turn-helix transcriptional regulator [Chloroflexota bacterium]